MTLAEDLGIGGAAAAAVVLVVYYARWALRTRERTGRLGLRQRSRLTCPKCAGSFDYDWVPGASLRAVRLGRSRYMACPLCGKYSRFDPVAGLERSGATP